MKFSEMTHDERRHLFETGTPAQVLKLAVWDIQEAERNGHKIDMSSWIVRLNDTCFVCLAGSILLNEYPDKDLESGFREPREFSLLEFATNKDRQNILQRMEFINACRKKYTLLERLPHRVYLETNSLKTLWDSYFGMFPLITTNVYETRKQNCLMYWTRLAELFQKYNIEWEEINV